MLGRRLRFVATLETGDVPGAEAEAAAFARRAETVGNPLYAWYVPLWRGMWLLARGQLAGAEAAIEEVREIGARAASVNAPMLAHVLLSEVLYQAGRVDRDHRHVGPDARCTWPTCSRRRRPPATSLGSTCAAGMQREARAALDRFHGLGVGAMPSDAEWMAGMAIALESAVQLDHPILPGTAGRARALCPSLRVRGDRRRAARLGGPVRGDGPLRPWTRRARPSRSLARRCTRTAAPACCSSRDSEITLADALTCRSDPGDLEEAKRLDAAGTNALADFGVNIKRPDRGAPAVVTDTPTTAAAGVSEPDAELRRDGDVWRVSYAGRETIVKHSKGLADLVVLLTRKGQEVHVTGARIVAVTAGEGGPRLRPRRNPRPAGYCRIPIPLAGARIRHRRGRGRA